MEAWPPSHKGASQKTYEVDSPAACVIWAVCLSQKNGCGVHVRNAAAYLIFQEEKL